VLFYLVLLIEVFEGEQYQQSGEEQLKVSVMLLKSFLRYVKAGEKIFFKKDNYKIDFEKIE